MTRQPRVQPSTEVEEPSSSTSESLLTPRPPAPTWPKYSDQHNVTPSPEPRPYDTRGEAGSIGMPHIPPVEAEDTLASGVAGLNIQSPTRSRRHSDALSALHSDNDDDLVSSMRDESLPDVAIYDVQLQAVLREAKGKLGALESTMRECSIASDGESNLSLLAQQTRYLAQFEYPTTRTIGFVGGSGVGKSSLISSLLDEENIAKSSAGGSACTNIVTEYRFLSSNVGGNYHLEVDYMTAEEVEEFLEELLLSYRAYYTLRSREVDDTDELNSVKTKAEKAWKTLDSLFKNQRELTQEFLAKEGTQAELSILGELTSMAGKVQQNRPGSLANQTWSASAETVDDLAHKLEPFIRDNVEDNGSPIWPFVRIIRIYLRSYILRNGLVLADLPGLQDLDYARVRASEKYMRSCQEVFAVAPISRMITDPVVKDVISRCGTHRPLRIVCTHSEDVNASEMQRTEQGEAQQTIRALRETENRLRTKLRKLEGARRRGWTITDRFQDLDGEVRTRDELQEAEFNLKKYLVERRNDKVRRELKSENSPNVMDGDLKVFCVSNKDYWSYRDGGHLIAQKHSDLSGIAALRRYCQSIPAEAQFRAVVGFLERQVPTLIGSIRQWVLQGSDDMTAQRAETLRSALSRSEEYLQQWTSILETLKRNLKDEFKHSVLKKIRDSQNEWIEAAIESGDEWRGWHPSSYLAFCRKYGNHTTKLKGHRNWNQELLAPVHDEINSCWGKYKESAGGQIDATIGEFDIIFDSTNAILEENLQLAPNALKNLLSNMKFRRNCVTDLMDDGLETLLDKIYEIQSDSVEGHDSSYMAGLMHPTYKACIKESGDGSDKRRKDHMSRRLSDFQLIPQFRHTIERAQWKAIDAAIGVIERGMEAEFDSLLRDLRNSAVAEGEISESQRFPEIADAIVTRLEGLDNLVVRSRTAIENLRK